VAPDYIELGEGIAKHAAPYLAEHGIEELQHDVNAITETLSPGALAQKDTAATAHEVQKHLVVLCHKMVGAKQFEVLMEMITASAARVVVNAMTKKGISKSRITLIHTIASELAKYDGERCSEILNRIQGLSAHFVNPKALAEAVESLAKDVLGEQTVNLLLGSALEKTLTSLQVQLEKVGVDKVYLHLIGRMGVHVGGYIVENDLDTLQRDLARIASAPDLLAMQDEIVGVCCKVVGSV